MNIRQKKTIYGKNPQINTFFSLLYYRIVNIVIIGTILHNYSDMKEQNSGRFEIDVRNLIQVAGALLIGALSLYATDTESFNNILARYISPEEFVVITGVLSYLVKKYLTNYSK